ncbi:helix-turn-helix domain-containing protein [Flavobacterium sp.]|uniref:helix-turn-helix domain-containing protein n=1 Tax=Flavobacterium sp. TaxID=239 RepID=UPI00260DC56E|nr:helix-turn-helix domain-containing protein [Flavobacterium sp.]
MYRIKVSIIIFFISFLTFSQTQKEIEFYKSKFFIYPTIGTDSAMYYTNKVFYSKRPIDLAFANAAKWQLLFVTNQKYNEKEFTDKIDFYVKKVPVKKEFLFELANIYNIKSHTYRLKGDNSKCYENLIIAQKYAEKNGDFKQNIKIKSNLSSIKGALGMHDKAIHEIKNLIKLIDKKNVNNDDYLTDWKNRNTINLSTFYIDKYNETQSKVYLDSASVYLNKMQNAEISDSYLALVYAKLGIINNELKKYDLANQYYRNSIKIYSKLNFYSEIEVNTFNLGLNLYQNKKYLEAKKNFKAIITNKKDTIVNTNYLFSHKYLANIYTLERNDSATYYIDRFTELYSKQTDLEREALAKTYSKIENKDLNEEFESLKKRNSKSQFVYIIVILILLFSTFISLIIYYKNKKNAESKYQQLLIDVNEKKIVNNQKIVVPIKVNNDNEKKIIEGLLKLENDRFFLRSDFNLHTAAKKIGSNTTYLTSVIKSYKKMSFNDYTNDLRINYILNELIENKKLQNYTIQSLAEVVGYKNGASFSKIFKQKTGLSPFQFIEKLKKTEKS